jgi:hypothetical protein
MDPASNEQMEVVEQHGYGGLEYRLIEGMKARFTKCNCGQEFADFQVFVNHLVEVMRSRSD